MLTYKGIHAGLAIADSLRSGLQVAAPGFLKVILGCVLFTAKTAVDYKAYKKGKISKKEFKRRCKLGAVATIGQFGGSSLCMVGGFALGQLLVPFPIVGGLIGTVVGGIIGGIAGQVISVRLYEKIAARLAAMDARKSLANEMGMPLQEFETEEFR